MKDCRARSKPDSPFFLLVIIGLLILLITECGEESSDTLTDVTPKFNPVIPSKVLTFPRSSHKAFALIYNLCPSVYSSLRRISSTGESAKLNLWMISFCPQSDFSRLEAPTLGRGPKSNICRL